MRKSIVCVAILMAAACGEENSTPSAPTSLAQSPTATSLSIGGATAFRTGQNRTLTADVTLSNGVSQPAQNPVWTSANDTVASVSGAGVVTANAHGAGSISVSAQGLTTQVPVQVWQDYQGTWVGSYIVRVCTNTGFLAAPPSWCSEFPTGSELPFRLTLTQTNGAANGTLELGAFIGPISGSIFDNRRFVGAGNPSMNIGGFVVTANVGTFSVLSSGNSLTGNLVVNITAAGFSGNGYWEAELGPVIRSLSPATLDTTAFESSVADVMRRAQP